MRDVRALVERLARNARARRGRRPGRGAPRSTLTRSTCTASASSSSRTASPTSTSEDATAASRVVHPASGLVTALEPVMRACSGSGSPTAAAPPTARPSTTDDRVRVPPGEESYVLRRVWLTRKRSGATTTASRTRGCGRCATSPTRGPSSAPRTGSTTSASTERFADAVCEEVDSDDPIVLVQDYHFALAPRMIRERLPRATILTFWHIPWPNAERLGICPWRDELLEGLLGTQHPRLPHAAALQQLHRRGRPRSSRPHRPRAQRGRAGRAGDAGAAVSRSRSSGPCAGWRTVPPVPECRAASCARARPARRTRCSASASTGSTTRRASRSACSRSSALLERHPEFRGRFTFVQLAAPSRTEDPALPRAQRARRGAGRRRINAKCFGRRATARSSSCASHHEPPTVFRYYRAADLCYVSSLHDGMNLVAKEFVAARDDERGVLVLSQFTGAARELTEALDRQPLRPRQAERCAGRGAAHAGRRAARAHAVDAPPAWPSSTSTAGPGGCWSTPPSCAVASG